LAEVLLVDADDHFFLDATVIAIYHDRRFIAESRHPGASCNEPRSTSGMEAKVLIEIVVVKACDSRLQNVRSWHGPRGLPPMTAHVQ
jgi:hypothetical protein